MLARYPNGFRRTALLSRFLQPSALLIVIFLFCGGAQNRSGGCMLSCLTMRAFLSAFASPRARRLVLLCVVPCWLLLSGGCKTHSSLTAPEAQKPQSPHALTPRSSVSTPVQQSAQYRQAVACYASHHYQEALTILDGLRHSSAYRRDQASQTFLDRQRFLCRRALGDKHARLPVPITPPSPSHRSASPADCGPRALLLVCQEQGLAASLSQLKQQAGTTARGTSLTGLAKAATKTGWNAKGVQMDRQALSQLSGPALAWVDGDHYIAVLSVSGDTATVHDPNKPEKEDMALDELLRRSGGILLTLSR